MVATRKAPMTTLTRSFLSIPLMLFVGCAPAASVTTGSGPGPAAPMSGYDAGLGPGPVVPPGPVGERCGNGVDDDSDGQVDEQCPCTPGQTQSCWPGDPSKRGNAPCIDGSQTCMPSGEFGVWGACLGAIIPSSLDECNGGPAPSGTECVPNELGEICNDNRDNDCDGLTDCADAAECGQAPNCATDVIRDGGGINGCRCVPGSTRFCHVEGECTWGQATCEPDGSWGPCMDAPPSVIPEACKGGFGGFGGLFGTDYDARCCVANGFCCDNQDYDYSLYDPTQPTHASIGNCGSVCAP